MPLKEKPGLPVLPVLLTAWEPSGTDRDAKSQILPHTQEAGDPYYIGDVYEKSRITAPGQWISSPTSKQRPSTSEVPGPYLSYLDLLSQGWPHISYLADFMRVTTSPPKLRFLSAENKQERARRTRISMLTFAPNGTVSRDDFYRSSDLLDCLNGTNNDHDHVFTSLLIVEDLSRDVIEALGARFDVDPLFFRDHISDYMWHNTRDPWVELPNLDMMVRKRTYSHVRYVQTRYFRSEDSLMRARREAGAFNVLRRVDQDGNWVQGADIPGSDVGLVRSRTSLWIRPNENSETGVLAILLVDPSITEGFRIWGGYRNLEDCPRMRTASSLSGPPRTSTFEDIVYWTSRLSPSEIQAIPQDPLLLFTKTLMAVCAEWYTLLKYATTRLTQLEWELENPGLQSQNGGLEITIKKLHSWRRRLPIFRALLQELLGKVVKQAPFRNVTSHPSANHLSELRQDCENLAADIEQLQLRADRIMSVVTAVMSIDKSKKAYQQNRSLARLTWLAVFFVPLTFMTGLFSMQADLTALGRTLWIYFSVATPLTAVALLLTKYGITAFEQWGRSWVHRSRHN